MAVAVTMGLILAPMAVGFGAFALEGLRSSKKEERETFAESLRFCR